MAKRPSPRRKHAPVARAPVRRAPIAIGAGVLALAALVAVGAWWALRAAAFTLPVRANENVLLVTIDTLRGDALGSYGGPATTPNLDRLAAHGARFTFAHAHAVVTLVSHASIFTGQYPYETGIRDNTGYRFPSSSPTVATRLKALGFATGAFIGGFPLDHRFGLNVGFDIYDDDLGRGAADPESGDRDRRADLVVASALDWIGKQPGKWFAFVHIYDPHAPYTPPPEWAARFPDDPYFGEVSWSDFALGALFDRLAREPRPTLVVVTGDHGESLGEHGELTHSIFAYESTLHIPLIIGEVGPGGQAASRGLTIDSPARHVDILPTLLDGIGAASSATAGGISGESLRAVIATGGGPDRPSYFEAMEPNVTRGWAPLRGVLVGREKYIDLPIPELYDLAADPHETTNLYASKHDRAEVLFNTLKGFNLDPPGRPRAETPDTIEHLRSLGYVGGAVASVREKYTEADDPKRLIELEHTMQQAAELAQQGHGDDAIALYRSVIAKRPDTEDAYRKLALIQWRLGRADDAIATLELALRNGVTQNEVRIKLGQYLTISGQPAKAIPLLALAGDDPDGLVSLGNAYDAAGKPAEALKAYRRLLAIDPTSGLAYEDIGTIQLEARDDTDAEASLRRAIALDPQLPAADTALGVLLAETNRRDEAIDVWTRAVALDATEFDALINLTKTLAEVGRTVEARSYGERFINTAPKTRAADVASIRDLLSRIR